MEINNYKGGAMRTIDEIKHAFQPVTVRDQGATHRMLKIQQELQLAAENILDLVPECADRTHAMRLLLDVKFWCVQAISHFQPAVAVVTKPAATTKAAPAADGPGPGLAPAKDH